MNHRESPDDLLALMTRYGLHPVPDRFASDVVGFPIALPLAGGQIVHLDLTEPAFLAGMDPEHVGAFVVDHLGYVRASWGLAVGLHRGSVLESNLAPLIETAFKGIAGSMYLDGHRYFATGLRLGESFDVFILVTNASEEAQFRTLAESSAWSAEVLRRIGKALTMNQNLEPIASMVVHEVVSACELAAALVWVSTTEGSPLELLASVGANRQGTVALQTLQAGGEVTCLAELVAAGRREMFLTSAYDNLFTSQLEAKFCYLKPGPVAGLPLMVGDTLIGVLELIGRDGDTRFASQAELFRTLAEHLSLALNSARLYEAMERLAVKDPLTGIANHRALQEFLHARMSEAARNNSELSVLMIDVDHFRAFNEEEGHDVGDKVLQRVAQSISETVRPYDLAARYGGEEFSVVLPGASRDQAMMAAERVRQAIADLQIVAPSGAIRHVSVSVGVAIYPTNASEITTLLKAADEALFTAKRGGRNCVRVYEGHWDPAAAAHRFDFAPLEARLAIDELAASQVLRERSEPLIAYFGRQLHLSRNQELILQALVLLHQKWARLSDDQRVEWERASDLRSVMPVLTSLNERFDGKGPRGLSGDRVPLLTRILHVVLASLDLDGAELVTDAQKFDPKLRDLVLRAGDEAA